MPVYDLYSKRKKLQAAVGQPEVYQYEVIPDKLRTQITMIWSDALGEPRGYDSEISLRAWAAIRDIMTREKGRRSLANESDAKKDCINYLLLHADTDGALDILELSFRVMHNIHRNASGHDLRLNAIKLSAEDATAELNTRLREHSVGYQFEEGQIIRVDSQFVHAEIVKPALNLLSAPAFESANAEFLLAHEHYRHGKYEDAVVAAQRAFESTMKCILTAEDAPFGSGDRAAELIKSVRRAGFLPAYLESGFDVYIAMLKTGLPQIRNNAGGHGKAPDTPPTPSFIASYAIHMTATNIIFLVNAYTRGKPKSLSS